MIRWGAALSKFKASLCASKEESTEGCIAARQEVNTRGDEMMVDSMQTAQTEALDKISALTLQLRNPAIAASYLFFGIRCPALT